MKLVSIETIPGQEFEVIGVVKGTIVQSKNFGKDFMAGMKTLVGDFKLYRNACRGKTDCHKENGR